jgi:hypothetical protein
VRHKGRKGKKSRTEGGTGNIVESQAIRLRTREKRKYGESSLELSLGEPPNGSAARETRQPNYFRDFAGIGGWDKAWVNDPTGTGQIELVSAKALFDAMRKRQWKRCKDINAARLQKWGVPIPDAVETCQTPIDPTDQIPM